MAELVPLTFENGRTIYVEATDHVVVRDQDGIQEAAKGKDAVTKAVDAAQELSQSVQALCASVVGDFMAMTEGRPTKATIEFGVNVSIEGNVYLVKGAGEASIAITAEWDLSGVE